MRAAHFFLMIFGIFVFLLVIASIPTARAGCVGATYDFGCGSTINESCTMNESVSCVGTAFHVGASNIVIDCNGYTIGFAASSTSGHGINDTGGFDNITIKNCNISQVTSIAYSHGIYLKDSDNSTIFNTTIKNTKYSCSNIYLSNSRYTNISKVNGSSTGSSAAYSIYLYSGSFNTVTDSNLYTASGSNGSPTVLIYVSHNNTIKNNNITDAGAAAYSHGISISDGSQNNTIEGNFINVSSTSDYSHGVSLKAANTKYNTIFNNTIITSGRYGAGVYIQESANNNNVSGNQINKTTNYGYGIAIVVGTSNTIENNLIYTFISGAKGLYSSQSSHNTYINNTVYNNNIYSDDGLGAYFEVSNNETLINNSFYNNRAFSLYVGGNSLPQFNHSIDTSNLAEGKPIYYLYGLNDTTFENLNWSGTYGQVFCGLCNNLVFKNITMGSDGLIFSKSTNITIKDSYFESDTGPSVVLIKTTNSTVFNNTMVNKQTANYAVELYNDADNNNVTHNNATAHAYNHVFWVYYLSNNNYIGNNSVVFLASASSGSTCYKLYQADNNTIENNYCDGNSKAHGAYIYDSENLVLSGNNFSNYGANIYGIYADQYSHNLTVKNNNIQTNGNPSHALIIKNSWNSTVFNNTLNVLYANSDALQLNNASNTNITSNYLSSKDWVIDIIGGTSQVYMAHNTLYSSGASATGGVISSASNVTMENNTITLTSTSYSNYGCLYWQGGTNVTARNLFCNLTNVRGIYFASGYNEMRVFDSIIQTNKPRVYMNANGILNFTNVSFSKEEVYFSPSYNGTLNVHWYLDTQVNYTNGSAVDGAFVTCYDNENSLVFNKTTYSNGSIDRQTLLEYMQNATAIYYKTNYSINATHSIYPTNSNTTERVNLTTNFIFPSSFVQLWMFTPVVNVYLVSPENDTRVYEARQEFSCNASSFVAGNITNITFYVYNSLGNLIYNETYNATGNTTEAENIFIYELPYGDDFTWKCSAETNLGVTGESESWIIRYFVHTEIESSLIAVVIILLSCIAIFLVFAFSIDEEHTPIKVLLFFVAFLVLLGLVHIGMQIAETEDTEILNITTTIYQISIYLLYLLLGYFIVYLFVKIFLSFQKFTKRKWQ